MGTCTEYFSPRSKVDKWYKNLICKTVKPRCTSGHLTTVGQPLVEKWTFALKVSHKPEPVGAEAWCQRISSGWWMDLVQQMGQMCQRCNLRILDTFFLRCQNNCHFNNVDCEKLQLTSFTTVSCVLFKAQARGYPRQGRWWMGNNVESPADKGPYQKSWCFQSPSEIHATNLVPRFRRFALFG